MLVAPIAGRCGRPAGDRLVGLHTHGQAPRQPGPHGHLGRTRYRKTPADRDRGHILGHPHRRRHRLGRVQRRRPRVHGGHRPAAAVVGRCGCSPHQDPAAGVDAAASRDRRPTCPLPDLSRPRAQVVRPDRLDGGGRTLSDPGGGSSIRTLSASYTPPGRGNADFRWSGTDETPPTFLMHGQSASRRLVLMSTGKRDPALGMWTPATTGRVEVTPARSG